METLLEGSDEDGVFKLSRLLEPGDEVRFRAGSFADRIARLVS